MEGGMTVLVALMALCGVNLVLIWQVATLIDSERTMEDEVYATVTWFIRREARRMHKDMTGGKAMQEIGYEPVEEDEHEER